VRTIWPERTDHLNPTHDIQVAITRLEAEERRIDQIYGGNGTIARAMAKELYGDENEYFSRYMYLWNKFKSFDIFIYTVYS
jgi:hypothetical protein